MMNDEFLLTPLEICLTHNYKDGIVVFLKAHPEYWEEAIELAIANKQPYSWRAAWLLWSCIEKNDTRIQPRIQSLIDGLKDKKDGHQRELLKILIVMELSEEQETNLLDYCIRLWKDIQKTPSIRYTAFRFINKIVSKYPELRNEIKYYTVKKYIETLSPGIQKSINKLIQNL
jgi:hypothetical protein